MASMKFESPILGIYFILDKLDFDWGDNLEEKIVGLQFSEVSEIPEWNEHEIFHNISIGNGKLFFIEELVKWLIISVQGTKSKQHLNGCLPLGNILMGNQLNKLEVALVNSNIPSLRRVATCLISISEVRKFVDKSPGMQVQKLRTRETQTDARVESQRDEVLLNIIFLVKLSKRIEAIQNKNRIKVDMTSKAVETLISIPTNRPCKITLNRRTDFSKICGEKISQLGEIYRRINNDSLNSKKKYSNKEDIQEENLKSGSSKPGGMQNWKKTKDN